jgi:hypothetical protein
MRKPAKKSVPKKQPWLCRVTPIKLVILTFGVFVITQPIIVAILLLKGVTGKEGVTEAMLLALFATPLAGALSALGALLAVDRHKQEPEQVEVTNTTENPVVTEEA